MQGSILVVLTSARASAWALALALAWALASDFTLYNKVFYVMNKALSAKLADKRIVIVHLLVISGIIYSD